MTNQISKVFNAYQSTLSGAMTTTATSLTVTSPGAIAPLTYLCIDPDDINKREYVLVGAVAGSTFSTLTRYLAGSAFGSGIAHDSGAVIRSVPLQQMWEDLHDRVTQFSNHANLTGLTGTGGHTDLISKTIVDAKGDLIVATAADTVARLAVGADDTIPMADAAQSTGLKWVASAVPGASAVADSAAIGTADTFSRGDHRHSREAFGNPGASAPADTMSQGSATTVARADHRHSRETAVASPFPSPMVDEYLSFLGDASDVTNAGLAQDYVSYIAIMVPKSMTFDAIAMKIGTGGATNARMGLYASDGDIPTTRLADAGIASCATSGVKILTFTPQVLASGLYFLAHLVDTSTALFTHIAPFAHLYSTGLSIGGKNFQVARSYSSGLPAPAAVTNSNRTGGGWPIIGLRRSA